MTTASPSETPPPGWRRLIPDGTADRLSWAAVAVGAGLLVAALARFWGANPGYADRLLVLLGAGYAAYTVAPAWANLPVRPLTLLGPLILLVGAVALLPGFYLLTRVGPRSLLLWWIAGGLIVTAGGLALARVGWPRLRVGLFALLFPLFALPIPNRVLLPLQDYLQRVTTAAAERVLGGAGYAVQRDGIMLTLPGGTLLIEEGCSGVRSVTALTAIAAFVAFWNGFGPVRGVLLVVLSVPVVAAANVLRVVLSGFIQESFGTDYVKGEWHEALGFGTVLVGLALVLLVAKLLGPPGEAVAVNEPPAEPGRRSRGWAAAGLLTLMAAGWVGVSAAGAAMVERSAQTAPLDRLPLAVGKWTGEDQPIPTSVTDKLTPDRMVYRVYENNIGRQAHAWVMFWAAGSAIKGYHHPDVCWGTRGFEATAKWTERIPAGDGQVPAFAREFAHDGRRQVVVYWTQEGPRVWSEEDERAAQHDVLTSSNVGHLWSLDMFGLRAGHDDPRLVVVVVIPDGGTAARRDAAELSKLLAAELYTLCPWAKPGQ
jgi:exosortase